MEVPALLQVKLMSKTKSAQKVSFLEKVNAATEWVGDSEERQRILGIIKLPNEDIVLNTGVFSRFVGIQPRSLQKNMRILGYHKKTVLEWANTFVFTMDKEEEENFKISEIPEGVPETLWDETISNHWNEFCSAHKDRTIHDLERFLPSSLGGYLSSSQLISLIYNIDTVTPHVFGSLLRHFGPLQVVNTKLSSLVMSVLSRGWSFNDNDEKKVLLDETNKFMFTDGDKHVVLENMDKSFKCDPYWLKKEDGETVELEEFWCFEFPNEIQSMALISDAIMKYFPEENVM